MEEGYNLNLPQFEYQPKRKFPIEKKPAVFTETKASKKKREKKIEEITVEIKNKLS